MGDSQDRKLSIIHVAGNLTEKEALCAPFLHLFVQKHRFRTGTLYLSSSG